MSGLRVGTWSIRSRLTSVFLGASLLVVLAVGALLLHDQQSNAEGRLGRDLVSRIDAIELSIRRDGHFPYSELYGEVIDADYQILGMSRSVDLPGLLKQSQADFVMQNGSLSFQAVDRSLGGRSRFLAQRRTIGRAAYVIAVGVGEKTLRDAHRRLFLTLLLGGPSLVALAGLGGWTLSGGVLRSVRKMTDDASAISQFESSARLAVPPQRDEIGHLGTTLNAMLDRLEASYRRERSFVDDASHELRTPLSILRGELELALLHPGDTAATAESLQRSIEEVDRLSAMTDDLLVLARSNRSERATVEPLDFGSVVRESIQRLQPTLTHSISIVADGEPEFAAIRRDHLERIIRNLVENADRFAKNTIEIRVTKVDRTVELHVDDDGPGFPPSFLPHAFERFTVASEARTRGEGGGTGLGLAIVHTLVENCGGSVSADNGETHGARVTVKLPLALIEPSPTTRDK